MLCDTHHSILHFTSRILFSFLKHFLSVLIYENCVPKPKILLSSEPHRYWYGSQSIWYQKSLPSSCFNSFSQQVWACQKNMNTLVSTIISLALRFINLESTTKSFDHGFISIPNVLVLVISIKNKSGRSLDFTRRLNYLKVLFFFVSVLIQLETNRFSHMFSSLELN